MVENHGLDVFALPAFWVKKLRATSDPLSYYFILIPLLCQSFDIHKAIRTSLFFPMAKEARKRAPIKLNSCRIDRAVVGVREPVCHYPYNF